MEQEKLIFQTLSKKNIRIKFLWDVTDKTIDNLESSFQDLFSQSEDYELKTFERQSFEEQNTKTILVKIPATIQKINHKLSFYRAVLQEELDSENLKRVGTILYYADINRIFYIQLIFEMS